MLSDASGDFLEGGVFPVGLNAPFGARCFLTEHELHLQALRETRVLMHLLALGASDGKQKRNARDVSLNAPFGARCFLTLNSVKLNRPTIGGLNAPFGARCFLTRLSDAPANHGFPQVLMHLLALGAF